MNDERIDQMLAMAEQFTHSILKSSLRMRQSELDHRKKQKPHPGGVPASNTDRKRVWESGMTHGHEVDAVVAVSVLITHHAEHDLQGVHLSAEYRIKHQAPR